MERKRDMKSGAGKIVRGALFVVLLILLLGSCEQMFTFSPLSWAQRDPANLSDAQKIAYAESVLGSGDADAMADAYNAIKDSSDPDVQYLASQLAVGASGINEAAEEILASIDTIDTATIDSILDGVDDILLAGAIAAMYIADGDSSTSEGIAPEDYLVTAVAVLIEADVDLTLVDVSTVISGATPDKDSVQSSPQDTYDKAAYYLQQSGYTDQDLEDLLNFS